MQTCPRNIKQIKDNQKHRENGEERVSKEVEEKKTHRDRETERQRDRETERWRDRETETEREYHAGKKKRCTFKWQILQINLKISS